MESVDLFKRFPTVLWLLNLVSIQPRTDRSKFESEIFETLQAHGKRLEAVDFVKSFAMSI